MFFIRDQQISAKNDQKDEKTSKQQWRKHR